MSAKKVTITIEVDTEAYLSDILCWLTGYLSNQNEFSEDRLLLEPAITRCRKLNSLIKKEFFYE